MIAHAAATIIAAPAIMLPVQHATAYPVPNFKITYVEPDHHMMWFTGLVAMRQRKGKQNRYVASTITNEEGILLACGNNYHPYHMRHGCEKQRLSIAPLSGYDVCKGCDPKTHSEPVAIAKAKANGKDVTGATLWLWGHTMTCIHCTQAVNDAGIAEVIIVKNAAEYFGIK
jgi:deoxycytidylate deaminase